MSENKFAAGDRVRVSDDFFWARGARGTISEPPHALCPGGELTRQEISELGTNTIYWIWFDEPQFDAEGDGPYRAGSIWESALTIVKDNE